MTMNKVHFPMSIGRSSQEIVKQKISQLADILFRTLKDKELRIYARKVYIEKHILLQCHLMQINLWLRKGAACISVFNVSLVLNK